MEFLIGALGAVAVIGLFAGGMAIGWKAHKKYAVQKTAEKLSESQSQMLHEQEQAQMALQGYSVERAYGLVSDPSILEGSDAS